MMRALKITAALVLAVAMVMTAGCFKRVPINDDGVGIQFELGEGARRSDSSDLKAARSTKSVARGDAKTADIKILMGAGDLEIVGGTGGADGTNKAVQDGGKDTLRGDFRFAPASIAPDVKSSVAGDNLNIEVSQPKVRNPGVKTGWPSYVNEWHLGLAKDLPMRLDVKLGAGNGDLDLRGVDVSGVTVDMGAGDLDLDLRGVDASDLTIKMGAGDLMLDLAGQRVADLDVTIAAGIGAIEVNLPKDIGVRVAKRGGGVGNWDDWKASGFRRDGSVWVNSAWGSGGPSIEVTIESGVGSVVLKTDDVGDSLDAPASSPPSPSAPAQPAPHAAPEPPVAPVAPITPAVPGSLMVPRPPAAPGLPPLRPRR